MRITNLSPGDDAKETYSIVSFTSDSSNESMNLTKELRLHNKRCTKILQDVVYP